MENEYLENLSKEFNLEEIEKKLTSTVVKEDTVKASDFFLLAKFQMKFGN